MVGGNVSKMARAGGITLAIAAGMALALLGAKPAAAITFINNGNIPFVINTPDIYIVTTDLTTVNDADTAIRVNSGGSGSIIRLSGRTITGTGNNAVTSDFGIRVSNASRVTIQGPGLIQDFQHGILFDSSNTSVVQGVTCRDNDQHGVAMNGSSRLVLQWNTASNNGGVGFALNNSDRCVLQSNTSFDNTPGNGPQTGFGLFGNDADNNVLQFNRAYGHGSGFTLGDGASGNTLQANNASGNVNLGIWVNSGATSNRIWFNTSLGNPGFDLRDDNADCDNNSWLFNNFNTRNMTCIN